MSSGLRLALYAAMLMAVFVAAYAAGSAFIPDSVVDSWTQEVGSNEHGKVHSP